MGNMSGLCVGVYFTWLTPNSALSPPVRRLLNIIGPLFDATRGFGRVVWFTRLPSEFHSWTRWWKFHDTALTDDDILSAKCQKKEERISSLAQAVTLWACSQPPNDVLVLRQRSRFLRNLWTCRQIPTETKESNQKLREHQRKQSWTNSHDRNTKD